MHSKVKFPLMLAGLTASLIAGLIFPCSAWTQMLPFDSAKGLQPHGVAVEAVTYRDRKAVRLTPAVAADAEIEAQKNGEGGGIAVVSYTAFHNGTIEIEVAGKPRAGAPGDARGFVGIAFRVSSDSSKYECFYIRPTNGRAEDQLRRNHSTQYISMPDYPWSRLRKESPGQYESYVDIVPGEWMKIKVEVNGLKRASTSTIPHSPC